MLCSLQLYSSKACTSTEQAGETPITSTPVGCLGWDHSVVLDPMFPQCFNLGIAFVIKNNRTFEKKKLFFKSWLAGPLSRELVRGSGAGHWPERPPAQAREIATFRQGLSPLETQRRASCCSRSPCRWLSRVYVCSLVSRARHYHFPPGRGDRWLGWVTAGNNAVSFFLFSWYFLNYRPGECITSFKSKCNINTKFFPKQYC